MADFTPTQGKYLAFIHTYTERYGVPPSESEISGAMCVSPPSVNQMVKMLEKKGLILRQPGQARSIRILVPADEIPDWGRKRKSKKSSLPNDRPPASKPVVVHPPANLYVLWVYLTQGPVSEKFRKREISRTIEIRGDQTLEDLHHMIFEAFGRFDEHLYEFQFGKRPFDPKGVNYGVSDCDGNAGDASTQKLDDLNLTLGRAFGYWFDFGDDWYHTVQVLRIEKAIPTVTYPRVIKRVGPSPPQYNEDEC